MVLNVHRTNKASKGPEGGGGRRGRGGDKGVWRWGKRECLSVMMIKLQSLLLASYKEL